MTITTPRKTTLKVVKNKKNKMSVSVRITTSKNKTTKSKQMSIGTFMSVVKKPELCGTNIWFKKNKKTGAFCAVCPTAKAAVKRGFRYKFGQNPIKAIAKQFNVNQGELKAFATEWDFQAKSTMRTLSKETGRRTVRIPSKIARQLLRDSLSYAKDMGSIYETNVKKS